MKRALKARLKAAKQTIVDDSNAFEARASIAELHLVPQGVGVAGQVTTAEMVALYDGRLASKAGPGRSIYSAIQLLPEDGRCPYCDHRDVSTLDHVLPKTLFPSLAVTPLNLVGSCKDCNKAKLAAAPTNSSDAVLHPYFEDISSKVWLRAKVVEQTICAVVFHVKAQSKWSDDLNERLRKQFETLGLARLYTQQAAREMSGIRRNLVRVYNAGGGGAAAVKRELKYQWESWSEESSNSWKSALYNALHKNAWFCDGGFRLGK
ncbi:hypothetical protein A6J80_16120 [Paracoccus yeei]|uniref:HNH endonuclease n=1 Tax=Paracoccus yeei TaxID=147645 RepID=A0A1V0GVJ1_9RHOB|nr:HNH endonuclease [Paracoccus yeei]ARC37689.1 hypothetical protein A6J80_16120 [Paracoccus yeei]